MVSVGDAGAAAARRMPRRGTVGRISVGRGGAPLGLSAEASRLNEIGKHTE